MFAFCFQAGGRGARHETAFALGDRENLLGFRR
jgi:hypothetical protein